MSGLIWVFVLAESSSILLAKYLLGQGIHPYFMAATASVLSAIFIGFYFSKNRQFIAQISKVAFIKTVAPSGLLAALGNLSGFIALKLTTATNYTFIARTGVLFTPLLAWIILREKINPKMWPLIVLVILGIWLLTGNLNFATSLGGDGLALVTALTVSLDFIYQKKAVKSASPEAVAFWRRIIQSIAVIIIWLITPQLGSSSLTYLGWLLVMAGCFVLMSLSMIRALKKHLVANFNLLINLSPVVAAIGSYWIFKEILSPWRLTGAALIFTSLLLFNLIKKQESLKLKAEL